MIKLLSSPRLTVICLFLLFVLTFWGTIAQVQQGLYAAQERYFNSFFFLGAGFIPFPGAQLVLWVLFVNLMASITVTFKKYTQWSNVGLLIIHFGLILYFVAAFMIFHFAQESNVRLAEGESTNVSVSYQPGPLKHFPLPFTIRLDHFKAEFHPGTDVAKSFESIVTITTGSLQRQVRIYMNNPLRYKDYTVYQASYDTDSTGRQHSTLAVVKNFAKFLPYLACFVVFFGLALHFLIQAFMAKGKI
jgi:cytochrome c biogenesis protein ResB